MSLPNFAAPTYQPPGVYWTETTNPNQIVTAQFGPVVAIVGPAIGYRIGNADAAVVLTGTTPVTLTGLGINLGTVVVTSTDGSITYTDTSDYVLTQTSATDGNALDTITTIARASSGSTITSGETVTITYHYADSGYYAPTTVTKFSDVVNLYGAPFNTNTFQILSPLSLAAQICFGNGASEIVLVATQGTSTSTTRTYLQAGLNVLTPRSDVNIIVELPVGITGTMGSPGDVVNVATDFSAYLDNQESVNEIFQIGLIGYETSVANGASGQLGADAIAQDIVDKRLIETWPNQWLYYSGYTNTTQVIGGYYFAAACAGFLASNPPQQGLTRAQINGFSGIPGLILNYMTTAYKNNLSAAGVCVGEINRQGQLQVRHGVTTDPANPYNREISLVRIQDYMLELLILSVENTAVIGGPVTPEAVSAIGGIVNTTLSGLVTSGQISSYQGVEVSQNSITPTEIDIVFSYLPIYPLNYVTISFSIDVSGS